MSCLSVDCRFVRIARLGAFQHGVLMSVVVEVCSCGRVDLWACGLVGAWSWACGSVQLRSFGTGRVEFWSWACGVVQLYIQEKLSGKAHTSQAMRQAI